MPPRGRFTRGQINAQLGRYGSAELINSQNVTLGGLTGGSTTVQFGNFITLDRPAAGFVLNLRGRLVIGTAAYTAGVPESFPNLIQRIFVNGQHIVWGNATPWDISGATAFVLPLAFQGRGNAFLSTTTRQADPGQPFVQTANLITTPATGTIDFDIYIWMPAGPFLGASVSSKRQQVPFFLRGEDWVGPLIFNVSLGDRTALGTPDATSTTTFTAFGSASGTPALNLFAVYSQLGDMQYGYVPGSNAVMVRNESVVPNLQTAVTATQALLAQLQANITTNVLLKTGVNLTGTTAGVQAFASLSDVQLDQTAILIGNRYIKNTGSNQAYKQGFFQDFMAAVQPQGYLNFGWTESGSVFTALRLDDPKFTLNANPQIKTAVLTASANNRQQFMQEYILDADGNNKTGAVGPIHLNDRQAA